MASESVVVPEVEVGRAELELGITRQTGEHRRETTCGERDVQVIQDCSRCRPEDYCCVELKNICISYGKQRIVDGISLNIMNNTVTAIIGPSGCGKSSFLCCINKLTDLIPGCSVTGDIQFQWDKHIYSKKATLLRKHVGMLFQKPNPFPFSIWKNLEFPLREHGITDKYELAVRIEKALSDVGLWSEVKDRLKESALSLSGGQQQRLCLARALVLEPSVLLMDEPCSALDPIATKKIEELTRTLSKRMTIIMVTHNLSQAKRVADYVALFWKQDGCGRMVEFDRGEAFFAAPKTDIAKTYLAYD
jgi:phosphate transport system ATP-binding protein